MEALTYNLSALINKIRKRKELGGHKEKQNKY